jgi:hypothetical protein
MVAAFAALVALASAFAMSASADETTLAVYGDSPYGTSPTDTAQLDHTPALVTSVNADRRVKRVIHVGDIHSGKQYCTESYDRKIFDLWTGFSDPVVYAPGDNEWADCHKVAEGGGVYNPGPPAHIDYVLGSNGQPVDYAGGDPLANLALVRSIFFPNPGMTLGQHKRSVLSQGVLEHNEVVENVIWRQSDIVFVTLNIPGGSNNDTAVWYGAPQMSSAQADEVARRTAADLRWIDLAFAIARDDGARGVVIAEQADMWNPEDGFAKLNQYEPFVQRIAARTAEFRRPVLLFNGDSHVYQADNPLSALDPANVFHPGYDVPNFRRVTVHGSTAPLEWLRLSIGEHSRGDGPAAFGPFRWERVMVP